MPRDNGRGRGPREPYPGATAAPAPQPRRTSRPRPRATAPEQPASASAPWTLDMPGALIATSAHALIRHGGTCPACRHALLRGDRVATLPGGRLIHVHCTRLLSGRV